MTNVNKIYTDNNAPPGPVIVDPNSQSYVAAVTTDSYNWYDAGFENLPNNDGPLINLYKNKFKQTALYYPKDLSTLGKGHSVQFDIRDIKPIETGLVKGITNTIKSMTSDPKGFASSVYEIGRAHV